MPVENATGAPPATGSAAGVAPAPSRVADTPRPPIFVLGDSRTGTLSLHNFFRASGLASLHWFVKEAGLTQPLHVDFDGNERKFAEFVAKAPYDAFSDYPTRSFFAYLYRTFPDASFILTVRKSTERWVQSMKGFLAKFAIELDEVQLAKTYEQVNTQIRQRFSGGDRRFLELCIDDDNIENTRKLKAFLGIQNELTLPQDNATASINNDVLSEQHRLYSGQGIHTLDAIEAMSAPSKAMISEYGWTFLINDSNDFLRVQTGLRAWSDDERARATAVIRARVEDLTQRKIAYKKFIIPEKSIVYREYLPKVLAGMRMVSARPAQLLRDARPEDVFYLDEYLLDARSYGQLYFRGDTHTNWLGAWLVYRFVHRKLMHEKLLSGMAAFALQDLSPEVASYDGDLWSQLNDVAKDEFRRWDFLKGKFGFELVIKLMLPQKMRVAEPVEVPAEYRRWFTRRETLVYERADRKGPRAVIFRDSTLDFCHVLLAQHFSRSVFVWHLGQVYDEVIRREQPDIILHIMAERFVVSYPQFPAFGRL